MEKRLYIQEDVCWSAFRLFDRNGDGKISQEELAQVLSNDDGEALVHTRGCLLVCLPALRPQRRWEDLPGRAGPSAEQRRWRSACTYKRMFAGLPSGSSTA